MKYELLNLTPYNNVKGISYIDSINKADFSGVGSSYPAEELPYEDVKEFHGVPFRLPNKDGKYDNMDFSEQTLNIPENTYAKMHILGAAENGSFNETIFLSTRYREHSYKVGLSEWIYSVPFYNEKVAIQTRYAHSQTSGRVNIPLNVWYQSIELNSKELYCAIKFGDNPGMHIFSITMERKGQGQGQC